MLSGTEDQNYIKANAVLNEAAEEGSADGKAHLGYLYQYGLGVNKDVFEALRLYKESAAGNSSFGLTLLGRLYARGDGPINQDVKKGVEYLEKALTIKGKDHAMARLELGDIYRDGRGSIPQNKALAIEHYSKATFGSKAALHELGMLQLDDNCEFAVTALKSAAEFGATFAVLMNQGLRFFYDEQFAKALPRFELVAEMGNEVAQTNAGFMYLYDLTGEELPSDKKEEAVIIENENGENKEEEKGKYENTKEVEIEKKNEIEENVNENENKEGEEEVEITKENENEIKRESEENTIENKEEEEEEEREMIISEEESEKEERERLARKYKYCFYYYKARAQQDMTNQELQVLTDSSKDIHQGDSFIRLGDMFYYGNGVEQNYTIAAGFYKQVSHRNSQAAFNLGYMYQFGIGVPQDLYMAKRMYDNSNKLTQNRLATWPALITVFAMHCYSYSLNNPDVALMAFLGVLLVPLLYYRYFREMKYIRIPRNVAAAAVAAEENERREDEE